MSKLFTSDLSWHWTPAVLLLRLISAVCRRMLTQQFPSLLTWDWSLQCTYHCYLKSYHHYSLETDLCTAPTTANSGVPFTTPLRLISAVRLPLLTRKFPSLLHETDICRAPTTASSAVPFTTSLRLIFAGHLPLLAPKFPTLIPCLLSWLRWPLPWSTFHLSINRSSNHLPDRPLTSRCPPPLLQAPRESVPRALLRGADTAHGRPAQALRPPAGVRIIWGLARVQGATRQLWRVTWVTLVTGWKR